MIDWQIYRQVVFLIDFTPQHTHTHPNHIEKEKEELLDWMVSKVHPVPQN